jgi:hypothetical protein
LTHVHVQLKFTAGSDDGSEVQSVYPQAGVAQQVNAKGW